CRLPVCPQLFDQVLENRVQARRLLQGLTQPFDVLLADHEGRALETAAVVVGAEADAEAAGRLALRVGEKLDGGLMPLALEGCLFDYLARAPVHLERAWELSIRSHCYRPPMSYAYVLCLGFLHRSRQACDALGELLFSRVAEGEADVGRRAAVAHAAAR